MAGTRTARTHCTMSHRQHTKQNKIGLVEHFILNKHGRLHLRTSGQKAMHLLRSISILTAISFYCAFNSVAARLTVTSPQDVDLKARTKKDSMTPIQSHCSYTKARVEVHHQSRGTFRNKHRVRECRAHFGGMRARTNPGSSGRST